MTARWYAVVYKITGQDGGFFTKEIPGRNEWTRVVAHNGKDAITKFRRRMLEDDVELTRVEVLVLIDCGPSRPRDCSSDIPTPGKADKIRRIRKGGLSND